MTKHILNKFIYIILPYLQNRAQVSLVCIDNAKGITVFKMGNETRSDINATK